MTIVSTDWGVIVAEQQQVLRVGRSLTEISYEHFLPLIEHLSISGGRHTREMKPLLGNYILVTICSAWCELLLLRGVLGFIKNADGYPARVNAREVTKLRELCPNNLFTYPIASSSGSCFKYGQRVSPKEGPFAFHVGRYESRKGRYREVAVFKLFGREQKVTFKSGDLIAA